MRKTLSGSISGVCIALVFACSSTHADDAPADATKQSAATCANWVQRLLDCKVLGGTEVSGCDETAPTFPCVWACTQQATCSEIKRSYCDDDFNGYAGCLNECKTMPIPFKCDDGTLIAATKQCDGTPDCPNGEDEDCTQGYISCNDGTQIPESWQCDGIVQCKGGEDEAGCPPRPMFVCATGESIDATLQCNGVPDCADGDDESDCAILTCDASPDDDDETAPPASDASKPATCAEFVQRLTACGAVTGTRLAGCVDGDAQLLCTIACAKNATCDAIRADYCTGAFNEFAGCANECRETEQATAVFMCGDGSSVPASYRCDGVADCANGADENCPPGTFTCANGLTIPAGWQCDGVSDCPGGEDELDCDGAVFTCDDGTVLAPSQACDGVSDCAGGEDEAGCVKLACSSTGQ